MEENTTTGVKLEPQKKYRFDAEGHVHTLTIDGMEKPLMGTTTLVDDVYPPPLAWWAAGLALEPFGWTNSKLTKKEQRLVAAQKGLDAVKKHMSAEAYLELLDSSYSAHNDFKKKAGKKGTDTHALVEDWIGKVISLNGGYVTPLVAEIEHDVLIEDFVQWSIKELKHFVWSEKNLYSERLWVGGQSDFGAVTGDGKFVIGDYKTAKAIYPKNFYQTAGYGIQFKENGAFTASGERVVGPGVVDGYVIFQKKDDGEYEARFRYDVETLEDIFEGTVRTYKDKQIFNK